MNESSEKFLKLKSRQNQEEKDLEEYCEILKKALKKKHLREVQQLEKEIMKEFEEPEKELNNQNQN